MKTFTFEGSVRVTVEAGSEDDARELMEDYLGDLGPGISVELEDLKKA